MRNDFPSCPIFGVHCSGVSPVPCCTQPVCHGFGQKQGEAELITHLGGATNRGKASRKSNQVQRHPVHIEAMERERARVSGVGAVRRNLPRSAPRPPLPARAIPRSRTRLEEKYKLARCLIQTAYFAPRLFLAFRLNPKRSKYLGIPLPSDSDDRGNCSGRGGLDQGRNPNVRFLTGSTFRRLATNRPGANELGLNG